MTMKRFLCSFLSCSSLLLLSMAFLSACEESGNQFKIEGRFLHINQGELYIYSLDDAVNGLDTIPIKGGRFAHQMACERPTTLIIVFPNLSEQPIFAEPGEGVDIKADASNLKEMEVEGTKDNELMGDFRKRIVKASPPDIVKEAEAFINDHPDSPVSVYLLRKYFIQSPTPDYNKAARLAAMMLKKQEKNGLLAQLNQQLSTLRKSVPNSSVASFTAQDVHGRTVTQAELSKDVAVINIWASWNYESLEMQRLLNRLKKQNGERLNVLGISIDADPKECLRTLKRDSIGWPNVCDGRIMESPLLKKLGFTGIPDNLILVRGRIVEHGLSRERMQEKLDKLLQR